MSFPEMEEEHALWLEGLKTGNERIFQEIFNAYYEPLCRFSLSRIEKCGGAALWTGEHIVLTIYGDNPATPAKDGFMPNENIHWKVYMHQQQVAGEITAEFSHDMPQYNGKFHMLGLSMIETIELGTVSLDEQDKQSIHLYPNPSDGSFAISGLNKGDEIKVYSASGKLVYISKAVSNLEFIDISISGIYIVELYTLTGELKRNKIIIY
jgi:hypothetical protein